MKRTTLRSSKGKKLYAVRNKRGQFKDIQTYKRAHSMDMTRTAKAEKRQRLVDYIVAFTCQIHGIGNAIIYKKAYNNAWDKMWAKIDRLKLFVILAIFIMASGVTQAQVIEGQSPPVASSLFNFGDFLHSMRAGYAVDQHGKKSEVYYTAVYDFHNSNGVSFATFNVGYEGIAKHPILMTGIRLDNILPLVWSGEWGKKHVSTAKLPTFEFGPFISVWPISNENLWKMNFKYGIGGAVGF